MSQTSQAGEQDRTVNIEEKKYHDSISSMNQIQNGRLVVRRTGKLIALPVERQQP